MISIVSSAGEVSSVTYADNVLPQLPPPITSRDSVRIFESASGYLHFHERRRGASMLQGYKAEYQCHRAEETATAPKLLPLLQ